MKLSSTFTSVPGVFQLALISTLYYLLGKFGQMLALVDVNVSPVWPASGFALAMLFIVGYKAWSGIFLGAFLFNVTTFIDLNNAASFQPSISLSASIAMGSSLQALAGYWILHSINKNKSIFDNVNQCSYFVLIVPLVCLIGSGVGVFSLWLAERVNDVAIKEVWLTWWLGDSTGIMIAAPLILSWHSMRFSQFKLTNLMYLSVINSLLFISAMISFASDMSNLKLTLPFVFLTWPFLIRLALKHSHQAVSFGVVLLSLVAVYYTSIGLGPFIVESVNQSLLLLQIYIFVTASAIYITSALTYEKNASLDVLHETKLNLEKLNRELEERVELRTKELKKARDIAENNARTDFLTGLNNRRAFNEYALNMRAQSKRFNKPYTIAMLDIDNFKAINDLWGHQAGDKSLQMIADSLNTLLREMDIKGRVGGEEFAILFPFTGVEDVRLLSERIREHIASQIVHVEGGAFGLTVSIGVAGSLDGTEGFDEIMEQADKALYDAKNGKKNNVKVYL